MTVEGVGNEDGCNGDGCNRPDRRPTRPANAHRARLLTPLPARIRLRLAVHGRAEWMWRTCRMI